MSYSRVMQIGVSLLFTALLAEALWGLVGLIGLTMVAMGILIAKLWLISHPVVPEQTVGVVFNNERKALARLLPPGRGRVFPILESLTALLSTAPDTISEITPSVRSVDGIPHLVEWTLAFELTPMNIPSKIRPGVVRILMRDPHALARIHMRDCVRSVLGQYPTSELLGAQFQGRFARKLRDEVHARLWEFGFQIYQVMLGSITPPKAYQQSITQAQQLSTLQKVLGAIGNANIQQLIELERVRTFGENGVSLIYSHAISPLADGQQAHPASTSNGQDKSQVYDWTMDGPPLHQLVKSDTGREK